jgi:hypothetical protein
MNSTFRLLFDKLNVMWSKSYCLRSQSTCWQNTEKNEKYIYESSVIVATFEQNFILISLEAR